KPFFPRATGYIKRTGPGLLQSAMTLGAGSATASVVAGASFGYKLLWVQPLAMFFGVMMLAALGNIVLSTGDRPYKAFGRETSKTLVFLWALATIASSVIWHFPQYGLASGAARDLVSMTGFRTDVVELARLPDGSYATKADEDTLGLVRAKLEKEGPVQVRAGVSAAEWNELTNQDGAEKYKYFSDGGMTVAWVIGALILGINVFTVFNYGSSPKGIKRYEWFLRSVIAMIILMFAVVVIASYDKIPWKEVGKGFIGWYGIPGYQKPENVTLVLGMLGASVGINMTFLYPYTLLAKGWGKSHKALSRWDLGMSMFLPFTIVTSLIMLAMTVTGVYTGEDVLRSTMGPIDAAPSLQGILGKYAGRIVFDLGLMAMTCSAVSTHMVVCGFTCCEMLGLEYTKARFRLFAMVPAIGIFGVVTTLPFWFPVAASAICFTLLPIAYLLFYLLNNKESYLGEGMMKWPRREFFNLVLVVALLVSVVGAVIQISKAAQNKDLHKFLDKKMGWSAAADPTGGPGPAAEEPVKEPTADASLAAPAGEPNAGDRVLIPEAALPATSREEKKE
ncbi:MAG: divalent metal cation transporter, partial [Thermoguttaceae bacterium]